MGRDARARPCAGPPRPWPNVGDDAASIKNQVAKAGLAQLRASNSALLAKVVDGAVRERFWQPGGGFDRNVRGEPEFAMAVRYIHRNPVDRGLVERPEDWQFSSVRWWMGQRDNEVTCDPPPGKGWEMWKGFM